MDTIESIALRFAQAAWEAGLWWLALAMLLLVAVVAVLGPRALGALRNVKPEPAPEPISDGGTAADRDLTPAEATTGEPGGGPTGGMG